MKQEKRLKDIAKLINSARLGESLDEIDLTIIVALEGTTFLANGEPITEAEYTRIADLKKKHGEEPSYKVTVE